MHVIRYVCNKYEANKIRPFFWQRFYDYAVREDKKGQSSSANYPMVGRCQLSKLPLVNGLIANLWTPYVLAPSHNFSLFNNLFGLN